MARVAVLVDRPPDDPSWKGAVAWAMVDALAESQHDIQVFTPLALDRVPPVHGRVNVARPGSSFGIANLLPWTRALVQYRPDVLHTIAPKDDARFANLTCWPYLEALEPILPRTRRVATLFDRTDVGRATARWLNGQSQWTVFQPGVAREANFAGAVDVLDVADFVPTRVTKADATTTLIPAPVGEWRDLDGTLSEIDARLKENAEFRVRIVGGWGDVDLTRRRAAWDRLGDRAARVEMGAPRALSEFIADAARAREVWSGPLDRDSWRWTLARAIESDGPGAGDSVNRLSRIYSAPGRW